MPDMSAEIPQLQTSGIFALIDGVMAQLIHIILSCAVLMTFTHSLPSSCLQYWKSNKNYFCEYCGVWMADNIQVRAIHEKGLKHKDNVARSTWLWQSCLLEGSCSSLGVVTDHLAKSSSLCLLTFVVPLLCRDSRNAPKGDR